MTIFQQMLDCDGNQINLFTTQFYNILNGGSESMYLALKDGTAIKVGSKSDASTQNNWYFEATSNSNYYYLKSQDL